LQPDDAENESSTTFCQVRAPSVVRQISKYWAMHPVAGEPAVSSQPLRSSTKAMLLLKTRGGSTRSSHVSPRSRERNRREPPTEIQTTPLPAAATNVVLGIGMGVALVPADGTASDEADDGLELDAGVVVTAVNADAGTTLGVVLGADGAVAQAEPSKAMAINQRRISTSIAILYVSRVCSVAHNAYGRARN